MPTVKSAERTLRFLELLANNRNGLSFTDIQVGLNIPKSSAYSLIQEFLDNNYLMYNDMSKKYYAGVEFIKLCAICIERTDLLQELTILTSELGQEIGQTTHAGILDSRSIVYLAKYEVTHDLSLMRNIGLRIPAHCTSVGKMLLSQYSDDKIRALYSGYNFQRFTENSIGDVDSLIEDLEGTRKRGYAREIREASIYAGCIALPLYQKEKMIASFSITFPAYYLETADIGNILSIMQKHKDLTEKRLFTL